MTDTTEPTITDTPESSPEEPKSLAEVAKEMYGSEFHDDGDTDADTEDDTGALTETEALDRLHETRDEPAEPSGPEQADGGDRETAPIETPDTAEDTESDPEVTQIRQTAAAEAQALVSDVQAVAARLGADPARIQSMAPDQLANEVVATLDRIAQAAPEQLDSDKGKAAAIKAQAREVAENIKTRYGTVASAHSQLTQTQTQRTLEAERAKMLRAEPELGDAETRNQFVEWLRGQGYRNDEIHSVQDHRVVVSHFRAFKADQAKNQPQARKVPKKRKGARKAERTNPRVVDLRTGEKRFRKTGRVDDALEVLKARRKGASR